MGPPAATAPGQPWIDPVLAGLGQEGLVGQQVLARQARQWLTLATGGPDKQPFDFFAITAQRVRRVGVFREPGTHGVKIRIRRELAYAAPGPVAALTAVERADSPRIRHAGGRYGFDQVTGG